MKSWNSIALKWSCLILLAGTNAVHADQWIDLIGKNLEHFRGKHGEWFYATEVKVDAKNPRAIDGTKGDGTILVNGKGKTTNIFTKEKFGDLELECEFMIPKGSNAGIKFHEWYEIQIFDSYGKKKIDGADCGGIYPRSELKPKYHHIDDGIAPLVNACGEPGSWQTLHVIFQSPRFNDKGEKIQNAKIVIAELNGKTIHKELELKTPTGSNWRKKEVTEGALMVQADHGPIAIRKLRVKRLNPQASVSAK